MADRSTRMPAVFIGHGNPMNALEHNRWTEAWAGAAAASPRPAAILAISAHWYINASAVTAMAHPRTIHDFFGFPDELFAFDYPAAGSAELVSQVVEVCAPRWIGEDADSWGLDHGTWAVLCHMFPAADIPVVQLSVDGSKPIEHHLDLGARLDALRDQGVLVVCSGNVVHNLRRIDFSAGEEGFDWAHRFDDDVRRLMTSTPDRFAELGGHPDHDAAVPTPDHFLPLAYLAGMASAAGEVASVLTDGYLAGSLSMTSYRLAGGGTGG